MSMEILKVSAKSSPNLVAGAIAGIIRESDAVEIQAIAAANTFLVEMELSGVCKPFFTEVMGNDEKRTAIQLVIMREQK